MIWDDSATNTGYCPPVPSKNGWIMPAAARSMGDRVSRLWGGSDYPTTASEATPSEFGQGEKMTSPVPAIPSIPAVYRPPRTLDGHFIMSREFEAPPIAYLGSDSSSLREERLTRVRGDLISRMPIDRQSTVSVPRFRNADSWVADQTNRLQLGGGSKQIL